MELAVGAVDHKADMDMPFKSASESNTMSIAVKPLMFAVEPSGWKAFLSTTFRR